MENYNYQLQTVIHPGKKGPESQESINQRGPDLLFLGAVSTRWEGMEGCLVAEKIFQPEGADVQRP